MEDSKGGNFQGISTTEIMVVDKGGTGNSWVGTKVAGILGIVGEVGRDRAVTDRVFPDMVLIGKEEVVDRREVMHQVEVEEQIVKVTKLVVRRVSIKLEVIG
jgi:hypothetical protein